MEFEYLSKEEIGGCYWRKHRIFMGDDGFSDTSR